MTLWVLLAKSLIILYCGERNLLATWQVLGWGELQTTLLLTHDRAQISKMSKQSICNHLSCHSDWLDSNILSTYMLIWYTHLIIFPMAQPHRFRTTGTLPGASRLRECRETFAWDFWGNSWLVWWHLPCRIPLISLLSTCSCCPYECILEFARQPGSSGWLGGAWISGIYTAQQLFFAAGL